MTVSIPISELIDKTNQVFGKNANKKQLLWHSGIDQIIEQITILMRKKEKTVV